MFVRLGRGQSHIRVSSPQPVDAIGSASDTSGTWRRPDGFMPRPPLRSPPGPLLEPEEAVPAPADGGQPGACADHGRRCGHGRDGLPPPVEPQRRRFPPDDPPPRRECVKRPNLTLPHRRHTAKIRRSANPRCRVCTSARLPRWTPPPGAAPTIAMASARPGAPPTTRRRPRPHAWRPRRRGRATDTSARESRRSGLRNRSRARCRRG